MKYTEDFETFWVKYPARWSQSMSAHIKRRKQPAFISWQKLSLEVQQECISKVHLIKQAEGGASAVRDCATWLNQEGWDDIDLPEENIKTLPKKYTNSVFMEDNFKIDTNEQRNKLRKGLGL